MLEQMENTVVSVATDVDAYRLIGQDLQEFDRIKCWSFSYFCVVAVTRSCGRSQIIDSEFVSCLNVFSEVVLRRCQASQARWWDMPGYPCEVVGGHLAMVVYFSAPEISSCVSASGADGCHLCVGCVLCVSLCM